MSAYFHSVILDEEKCKGCTNCIKKCPTEAIRVTNGKARIIKERCIDCGECIRVCPYHAKKALSDPLEMIEKYRYKVAIPAPSLYSQFKDAKSRNHLLTAVKKLGFDEVFEVARAAEIVTAETKKMLKGNSSQRPFISSACPAVVRLIQVRFPNLIGHIVKLKSPMEVAAMIVKDEAIKSGMAASDIGVFFITPCAAKITSVKAPYENKTSYVDGVISIKDIYVRILNNLTSLKEYEELENAGHEGIGWADSGGESMCLPTDKYLAVDGIHNVIAILEAIEDDMIDDADFIEILACPGGCLGGPLTVENIYIAKARLRKFIEEAKLKAPKKINKKHNDYKNLGWTEDFEYKPVMKLDSDFAEAIRKMDAIEKISKDLPDLDCGACGAPSCRALAEDIVRGHASETDCIFKLRDKISDLTLQMLELEKKTFHVKNEDDE